MRGLARHLHLDVTPSDYRRRTRPHEHSAPKQRTTKAEKQAIKAGRIPEAWQAKPAKLRQKDRLKAPLSITLDGEVHQGQARPGR